MLDGYKGLIIIKAKTVNGSSGTNKRERTGNLKNKWLVQAYEFTQVFGKFQATLCTQRKHKIYLVQKMP